MERYKLENSREFKAAMELENALNDMSWDSRKFAESIIYYHRTLFRSIIEVIKVMGSENYGYDLRNEASHNIARNIVESGILDNESIPFI